MKERIRIYRAFSLVFLLTNKTFVSCFCLDVRLLDIKLVVDRETFERKLDVKTNIIESLHLCQSNTNALCMFHVSKSWR